MYLGSFLSEIGTDWKLESFWGIRVGRGINRNLKKYVGSYKNASEIHSNIGNRYYYHNGVSSFWMSVFRRFSVACWSLRCRALKKWSPPDSRFQILVLPTSKLISSIQWPSLDKVEESYQKLHSAFHPFLILSRQFEIQYVDTQRTFLYSLLVSYGKYQVQVYTDLFQ